MKSKDMGLDNNPKKHNQYIEPVVTILLSIVIWIGIMVVIKSVMTSEAEVSITNNTAEELSYSGRYDEAIAEYTKMQANDKWPIWSVRMAEIYSLQGDLAQSNNLLKEAIVKRDKLMTDEGEKYLEEDKELINEVIFNFYMNGEIEQAESLGEFYLQDYYTYKPLIKTMVSVYLTMGDKAAAEELVNIYPVDVESSYDLAVLGNMQIIVDDYEGGLDSLKKAWDLNNNEIKIYDVIMEICEFNKDKLSEYVDNLCEQYPNEKVYEKWKMQIDHESISKHSVVNDVINEIDLTIDKNNLDEESYVSDYVEGWRSLLKEDYAKAMESGKKTIASNSIYSNVYGMLIPQILIAQEDTEYIELFFRKAIEAEPYNYCLIANIAEIYNEIGMNDKANEYYSLAIGINNDEGDLYYKLAFISIDNEDYKAAEEGLLSAIKLEENPNFYRTLGTVYYNDGEKEKAIESIRKAYALNEKDALALNNAACYYIMEDKDIWRGYSNIESAYNEMDENLDSESKALIEKNYEEIKKVYDVYINNEDAKLLMPDLKLSY